MNRFFYYCALLSFSLFLCSKSPLQCEEDNPFFNLFQPLISSINQQLENIDDEDDDTPIQPPPSNRNVPTPAPAAMPLAQQTQNISPKPNIQPQVAPVFVRSSTLPEIRGAIKRSTNADPLPRFRVLFKGQETMSNPEGFFTFPVDTPPAKYSILLCKQVTQIFDKNNTLKYMTIPENHVYRYFVFQKNIWEEHWDQQEKKLNSQSRKIPKHSIVIFIDPEIFDHFETWNIALASNVIKLPLLVLKPTTSAAALQTASADSILRSLDTTIFHQPIKQVVSAKPAKDAHKISLSVVQE